MLVAIAIIGFLSAVVASQFGARDRAAVRGAADAIVAHLEEAKANAVAGKFGTAHGVRFAEGEYTVFAGSSYDEDDEGNTRYAFDDRLTVTYDLADEGDTVVFARVTGAASATGTVTVSAGDVSRTVRIGERGDISIE